MEKSKRHSKTLLSMIRVNVYAIRGGPYGAHSIPKKCTLDKASSGYVEMVRVDYVEWSMRMFHGNFMDTTVYRVWM